MHAKASTGKKDSMRIIELVFPLIPSPVIPATMVEQKPLYIADIVDILFIGSCIICRYALFSSMFLPLNSYFFNYS